MGLLPVPGSSNLGAVEASSLVLAVSQRRRRLHRTGDRAELAEMDGGSDSGMTPAKALVLGQLLSAVCPRRTCCLPSRPVSS